MVSMRDLWRRSSAILSRREDEGVSTIDSLPCAICRQPAVTWIYTSMTSAGTQVIEGNVVCAEHGQLRRREAAG